MKLIIQTKQNSNQSFGVFEFVGKSWLIQTSPFPIHECERDPETLPVDHSLTPRCARSVASAASSCCSSSRSSSSRNSLSSSSLSVTCSHHAQLPTASCARTRCCIYASSTIAAAAASLLSERSSSHHCTATCTVHTESLNLKSLDFSLDIQGV